jgi:hypothetical protein
MQACRPWGVPDVPWHPQILAHQLTLSQQQGGQKSPTALLAPPNFQNDDHGIIPEFRSGLISVGKTAGFLHVPDYQIICFCERTSTLI